MKNFVCLSVRNYGMHVGLLMLSSKIQAFVENLMDIIIILHIGNRDLLVWNAWKLITEENESAISWKSLYPMWTERVG